MDPGRAMIYIPNGSLGVGVAMSEQAQGKAGAQRQAKAAGETPAVKVPWWRSLDRNVVFMHIPKAGGSTVRSFIADHVDADQVFPQDQLHHFPSYESLKTRRTMLFLSLIHI